MKFLVSEILSRIEIGSVADGISAAKIKGYFVINVAEPFENVFSNVCFPIDCRYSVSDPVRISSSDLDRVAYIIQYFIDLDSPYYDKIMIHCSAGIERSPLCVAWWLHTFHNMTLDEAYEMVKKKRSEVIDRRNWIQYSSVEEFLRHNQA